MKTAISILIFSALLLFSSPSWSATIDVSNASPVVGEKIKITLDHPADTLTVSYRPNSSVVKTAYIVNNPSEKSFDWVPEYPGVVALSYVDKSNGGNTTVSRNLSIRFDGLSVSGLLVMLFAGTVLFGGAGFAFRTLFAEPTSGQLDSMADFPADT